MNLNGIDLLKKYGGSSTVAPVTEQVQQPGILQQVAAGQINTQQAYDNRPLTEVEQLCSKIVSLQEQLRNNLPGYESMLFHIHKALAINEELAVLLTEEEIGVICAALGKRKGIVLAKANTKSNKLLPSGKSVKDLSIDDL